MPMRRLTRVSRKIQIMIPRSLLRNRKACERAEIRM